MNWSQTDKQNWPRSFKKTSRDNQEIFPRKKFYFRMFLRDTEGHLKIF